MEEKTKRKKPLLKRWWFWLIVIFSVIVIIISVSGGDKGDNVTESPSENGLAIYLVNEDVRVTDVRWKVVDVKDRGNTHPS